MEKAINNFYLYQNINITDNQLFFKKNKINKTMLYLLDNYDNSKYKMIPSQFQNIKFHHYKDIYIFHNVIDEDFCVQLIELLNKKEKENNVLKEFWKKGSNVQCSYIEIKQHTNLDKKIYDIFTKYFKIIQKITSQCKIISDSGYVLRRIYGETRRHSDGIISHESARSISAILALNTNYNDGIFKFPKQNLQIKMKKGDLILFPPYWTHPHQVSCPSNNTNRFTINTWGTFQEGLYTF